MEKAKKILQIFLGIPSTIISFLFIFKILFDNRQILIPYLSKIDLTVFLIGIFFFSIFFTIKGLVWLEILKKKGHSFESRDLLYQYSLSEFKRYIPGSIFSFISRFSTHQQIPKKELIKSMGTEALIMLASAFTISLPMIFKVSTTMGFVVILLTAISLIILSFYKKIILRIFLKYINLYFVFLAAWVSFAIGCYFVTLSAAFINPVNINFILSSFVLSWLLGYLFFIAPMGLGARELASVYLLSYFTPLVLATLFSLLSRIGMIIGEIFYLILIKIWHSLPDNSRILKWDKYLSLTVFFCILYFLLFSYLSIAKHDAYLSGRFDLGNMSQTVWNTSQGRIFQLTNPDGVNNILRLGIHSDFILILIAPLYKIWSDPKLLLVIQSLFISIGGIYTYLLAVKVIKNQKIGLALGVSYLLNFWIHQQNLFDFHAVTIATSILIASFYYLYQKKWALFAFFLSIALLTKENVFLVSSLIGIYIALTRKRIFGIVLCVASIAAFVLLAKILIPHFRGGDHFALSYFSYLGDTPCDMIKNLFVRPNLIISHIFSISTLEYFVKTFMPIGFLSLLSPVSLLFSLPEVSIYLLSSNQNLRSHYYHYGALIVPFVYISTIFGVKKILQNRKFASFGNLIFFYILFCAFLSVFIYSPIPGMKSADYRSFQNTNKDIVRKYLTYIPDDAKVSASNNIGAHLSNREKIYVAPRGFDQAQYIALYGESEEAKSGIDKFKYEAVIEDQAINFYLYKRKISEVKPSLP